MELKLNSQVYYTGKLSAFAQLHLSRRLAPFVGGLVALSGSDLKLTKNAAGAWDFEGDMEQALTPFLEGIANMKDEDVEYIVNACLDVAHRKNTGGTTGQAPVRQNGVMMFEIPLHLMLWITYHTIRENMTDFFTELPSLPGLGQFLEKVSNG